MSQTNKGYKDLSEELDTILKEMQSTDIDIDEAVKLYERGMKISRQIEKSLKLAKNRVTEIKNNSKAEG